MGYLHIFGFLILHSAQFVRCDPDDVSIRPVTTPIVLGDGPFWDPQKNVLYFVDIASQTLNRFDPVANLSTSSFIEGGVVSMIIPTTNDNEFIITRGRDLVLISWDGFSSAKPLSVLATIDEDKPTNQLNDGKADASGRLWIGSIAQVVNATVEPNQGTFFSFSSKDKFCPETQFTRVSISNGLGWNKDDTFMYHIDSPTRKITVFDFNLTLGKLSNGRNAFDFDKYDIPGLPDGMAVDEHDNLWVGVFNGARVIQVDPSNGNLLRTIHMPVTLIDSCAFGGPDLRTLYVTSGRLAGEPLSGSVFAIEGLGVSGVSQKSTFAQNNSNQIKSISQN